MKRLIVQDEELWLTPEKMIWWPAEKTLIIADLHLGKTGHFRKSGIAVPQDVFKKDLHQLFAGIQFHKPQQVFIAGDMFHSKANTEMDLFTKWRNDLSAINFHLIKGNHDILHDDYYKSTGIGISKELHTRSFSFIHDIAEVDANDREEKFYFSGHVHPAVSIHGMSRQSLSFPCFYFTKTFAVLPAFSAFSGHCIIRAKKTDSVFAIVNNSIVQIQ